MDFLKEIHSRLAEISVSGSSLRKQGAAGMVATARNFLRRIDLQAFKESLSDEQIFNQFLDERTIELVKEFQSLEGFRRNDGEGFGAARKSLNLFFREVVYNKFMAEHLELPADLKNYNLAIQYLEIPLDKDAAEGIFKYRNKVQGIPDKWPRIVHLNHETNKIFQQAAQTIANREEIARIHLDLIFWRKPITN